MKKIFVFSMLILGLIGCEKKVEITPKEEKVKIVQGMFNYDQKMKEKYYTIKAELQAEADKGNKSAEEELDRWEKVKDEEMSKNMSRVSKETQRRVDEMRRTGKLW